MKTIYLASPYGFSEQQKRLLLPELVQALEDLGLEVWEPFQRNNQVDFSLPGWAYKVGQADCVMFWRPTGYWGSSMAARLMKACALSWARELLSGSPPFSSGMISAG